MFDVVVNELSAHICMHFPVVLKLKSENSAFNDQINCRNLKLWAYYLLQQCIQQYKKKCTTTLAQYNQQWINSMLCSYGHNWNTVKQRELSYELCNKHLTIYEFGGFDIEKWCTLASIERSISTTQLHKFARYESIRQAWCYITRNRSQISCSATFVHVMKCYTYRSVQLINDKAEA